MFWEKCGKILTKNGKIVDCRDCPCGYWALFVFKIRSYNQETGDPYNECSWSYDVQPMEVINSKINYENYGPRRCIEVNRHPGADGSVGYVKNCVDCWDECCEWNEDWSECIRTCKYCYDCSEIFVYRLSPCFETMNEFAEWFYSGCGVEPDGNGNYPALTEVWYGSTYMSSAASTCVENYWRRKALDKYALNYEVFVDFYAQEWQQWFWAEDYEYETYTYSYCTSPSISCDCASYGDSGCTSCTDGCTLETYTEQYPSKTLSEGVLVVKVGTHGENASRTYARIGGWYGLGGCYYADQECYHSATCCDFRNNAASAVISATAPILPAYADKNQYIKYANDCFWSQPRDASKNKTFGCTDSRGLCCDFAYSLGVIDYYYWSPSDVRILGNWPKITIRRNSYTPPGANGIRAKMILTRTWNGLGQPSQTSVSEQTVDLMFGLVYEGLPVLTNVSLLRVTSTPNCKDDCKEYDGGEYEFEPYTSGAAGERMDVHFIGLEYI